jgi:hypothetical protein
LPKAFALYEQHWLPNDAFTTPGCRAWVYYVLAGAIAHAGGRAVTAGECAAGGSRASFTATAPTHLLSCLVDEMEAAAGRPLVAHDLGGAEAEVLRTEVVRLGPGAVTPAHRHAGPGLRYLLEGRLGAEVGGRRFAIAPGEAWLERPEDLIVGRTLGDEGAAFVRFMLLPAGYRGRSSFIGEPAHAAPPRFDVAYRRLLDEQLSELA